MSSFYDDQVRCPRCGKTPVIASDSDSGYLYLCMDKEGCGFETQNYEQLTKIDKTARMLEEKPPRPDVEGIRRQAKVVVDNPAWATEYEVGVVSLCDYTLAVEKERDALKAIEVGASFAKQDRLDKANSLLAGLVDAGICLRLDTFGGHSGHRCRSISYGGTTTDGCDCNFPLFFDALVAAEQYLDKGEK